MSRFDKIPPGGRFRAEAAAALDGQVGLDGNGDLLVVNLDAAGRLVLPAAVTECFGIIWTAEKAENTHRQTAVEQRTVVGGQRYTVMRIGEILDAATFDTPIAGGTDVYAAADGTFGASAIGAIYIGTVLPREEDSTQLRLVVNVNGQPVGA